MHEDVHMMGWVNLFGGPKHLPPQPEASCDALLIHPKYKGTTCTGKRPNTGNSAEDDTKE